MGFYTASDKQMSFLCRLGYAGSTVLSSREASALIDLALAAGMDAPRQQVARALPGPIAGAGAGRYQAALVDAYGRASFAQLFDRPESARAYAATLACPARSRRVVWVVDEAAVGGWREVDPVGSATAFLDELNAAPATPAAPARERVTEPGMYRVGEGAARRIFKVQRAQVSGNLYAKELVRQPGATVRFAFEYAPGAMAVLSPADTLSLEEAKAFGVEFGWCCVCGAELTEPTSVANGIGPVCAKRLGVKRAKAQARLAAVA